MTCENLTYEIQSATIETDEGRSVASAGLHFTGVSEKCVQDILSDSGTTEDRTERAECAQWLLQELIVPHRTKEIEAEARTQGFSVRTLKRARKALRVKAENMATGSNNRNEWWLSLPGDEAASS